MREFLFRGKRLDNGEWVEGFYVCLHDSKGHESHRIYTGYAENDCGDFYPDWFEVDPETVGPFTGLPDKNGKKIFDGDIIRVTSSDDMGFEIIGKVELMDGCYRVYYCIRHDFGRVEWIIPRIGGITEKYTYEIIGNIHDNPELLKGE